MRHTISQFLILNFLAILLLSSAGCSSKKPQFATTPDVEEEPVLTPDERAAEEKYSKSTRQR